jgi:hypothetical protein
MNLFDFFWPGQFHWYELLFSASSYVVGLFLLVIAGLAFTQHYRRPRQSRLLLVAIGLTLVNTLMLWRMTWFLLMLISNLSGTTANINLLNFGLNVVTSFIGVAVNGVVWWCLFTAAFRDPPPLLEDEEAEESLA